MQHKKQNQSRSGMAKKGKLKYENRSKRKEDLNDDEGSKNKLLYPIVIAVVGCLCGITHRNHIATLFENDKHFSHLSTLERELAFRTEMGLYYSYFKTVIDAPTFFAGLNAIMNDNVTEYPLTINTLKRFNLYPEVLLGAMYRVYDQVSKKYAIQTKSCWNVNRGEGMTPVESCEGLGEPSYFYVEFVFLINGINMAVFFFFGTYLSGSIFGGLLTVLSHFFNHGECTRVQWSPPLRESFAYPFFVMQMFIVTHLMRCKMPTLKHSLLLATCTVVFMLPWQFAQFALLTQLLAVFGVYVLQFIGCQTMVIYLSGQLIALVVSFIFLFGNEMLLTSFFLPCLISIWGIVLLEKKLKSLCKFRIFMWIIQSLLLVIGGLTIKLVTGVILQVKDDEHIGELLRSKFSDFKTFHTMLYTCAAEFDFMESETPWRVLKTLLAPCCIVGVLAVIIQVIKREWKDRHLQDKHSSSSANGDELSCKPDADLVYHVFQLAAFTVMAIVIMRLKLFWTPHLCLLSSLIASPKLFSWTGERHNHLALVIGIMAAMSVQGIANLQQQWNIVGEFSNYPLEQLVEWINHNTQSTAVFGGPMPIMATVKLCTGRPIVNHPHYEDAGLRARTKQVYTMYSRKPAQEIWQNYNDLQVDYAILEEAWCARRSKPGCGMAEIWDLEDAVNRDNPPTCLLLRKNPLPYFQRVFQNNQYDVLKIVRPKPSS